MKILFHPIVDFDNLPSYGHRLDFGSDSLFHGLRDLLGKDCTDFPKMEHMYKGEPFNKVKLDKCKGFTLYNRLEDIDIERGEVGGFDLVVCPVHHSVHYNQEFVQKELAKVRKYYEREKIAIIDANDAQGIAEDWRKFGRVFKRELSDHNATRGYSPIWFAVPAENFVKEVPAKDLDFAPLIPCYLNQGFPQEKTYIYNDEEHYNRDYQRSRFAFTCGKGGWDCLRHLEILSAGTIPVFTDLENCPKHTLYPYPKDHLLAVKWSGVKINGLTLEQQRSPFKPWDIPTNGHTSTMTEDAYLEWANWFLEYGRTYLTTEALARYVLTEMRVE